MALCQGESVDHGVGRRLRACRVHTSKQDRRTHRQAPEEAEETPSVQ